MDSLTAFLSQYQGLIAALGAFLGPYLAFRFAIQQNNIERKNERVRRGYNAQVELEFLLNEQMNACAGLRQILVAHYKELAPENKTFPVEEPYSIPEVSARLPLDLMNTEAINSIFNIKQEISYFNKKIGHLLAGYSRLKGLFLDKTLPVTTESLSEIKAYRGQLLVVIQWLDSISDELIRAAAECRVQIANWKKKTVVRRFSVQILKIGDVTSTDVEREEQKLRAEILKNVEAQKQKVQAMLRSIQVDDLIEKPPDANVAVESNQL